MKPQKFMLFQPIIKTPEFFHVDTNTLWSNLFLKYGQSA